MQMLIREILRTAPNECILPYEYGQYIFGQCG